jgi:hypothetical protein
MGFFEDKPIGIMPWDMFFLSNAISLRDSTSRILKISNFLKEDKVLAHCPQTQWFRQPTRFVQSSQITQELRRNCTGYETCQVSSELFPL